MRRLTITVLAAALMAACSPAAQKTPEASTETVAPPAPPKEFPADVITPDGIGLIRIGMSLDDLEKAAGLSDGLRGTPEFMPSECVEGAPPRGPAETIVMVQNYKVTRLAVRNTALRTAAGIKVGDTEEAVMKAYGARAQKTPHKYEDAPAAYLTVWETGDGKSDASRGLQFVTDAQRIVRAIHAGGPSITYVEGCL